MNIRDNYLLTKDIETSLEEKVPIKLGINKKNELVRLIYEITKSQKIGFEEIFKKYGFEEIISGGKNGLFHKIKNKLVSIKYLSIEKGDNLHIMPLHMMENDTECEVWNNDINPKKIYIEKSIKKYPWTEAFISHFKDAEIIDINDEKEGFKILTGEDSIGEYNRRRENVFLVKNKRTFIKKCPCTKCALGCGYTILNVGFGCAIDCTYCYLQSYTNFPALVLPANIEDYYSHILELDRKSSSKIRIGTGEFTDSLFLDKYTSYSKYLIPFFKNTKNIVFELKTKVKDIDTLLENEPHDNVVVSWSINTREMSEKYEKGASSISDRVQAAYLTAKRGFNIGFHFDPIIFYPNWEKEYEKIIKELFSYPEIVKKTKWISLGTLRYTPGLKQISERRFDNNLCFYEGEFYLDVDQKLRYKREIRVDIYNKMARWIKGYVPKCWVYLCMEPKDVWDKTCLIQDDYIFKG